MTFKEEIDNLPPDIARQARKYVRQWAYDCAVWERNAIAEFGSISDKIRATNKITRIYRGTGS